MKKNILLSLLILVFFLTAIPNFAASGESSQDKTQERLADLCRLWGKVKYFHPYLAYKQIDWDQALVETVPKVIASRSGEEYQQAVEFMLSFLEDPNTRILDMGNGKESPAAQEKGGGEFGCEFTDDNIAIIDLTDISGFADQAAAGKFNKMIAQANKAQALIFDLRQKSLGAAEPDAMAVYYFNRAFSAAFPQLIAEDIKLPSYRYRMHSGYAPQAGNSSGGYYSGFVYVEGQVLNGQDEGHVDRPLVFILDVGGVGLDQTLTGLQLAGRAVIIQIGKSSQEGGAGGHVMELSDDLRVSVRNTEVVNPDGTIGFTPDLSLPDNTDREQGIKTALAVLRGEKKTTPAKRSLLPPVTQEKKEKPYLDMTYPEEPYRLLALFRYWNVINYFFPYKHLLDRPWDEVLREFIPRLRTAGDALEYTLAVAEMGSHIKDTHGFMGSKILSEYFGTNYPPVEVRSVQGKTVIWEVFENAGQEQGLERGDVVLAVDEEEISARRSRLERLVAASTPQAKNWRVNLMILAGPPDSKAKLSIKKSNGNVIDVVVPRGERMRRSVRKTPVFSVLPSGFGYIDLTRLTIPQVDEAFETIKDTSAVIFDMRGYPNGTAWSIAPRLAEKKVKVASFRRPETHALMIDQPSTKSFYQYTTPADKWRYTGKVVVLIDENAISQAEHTCMFLESVADTTFIGTPTNGANGDVTMTLLPGGIRMTFTGHDVRHADDSQLQRVGIQPHIKVEPTIAGVRAGKDEFLARAVEFLQNWEE